MVVGKGKVNQRVDLSQEGQWCLERDTRVCTLPQEKEPRVAKVVGEVEVSTREAMGVVGQHSQRNSKPSTRGGVEDCRKRAVYFKRFSRVSMDEARDR